MAAYYNEHDPYAAEWLRNLIRRGLIADGVVDDRSIADVAPCDVREFEQCHFFAGVGGWSIALRLVRWDDSRPVWTGSCPCQPFSVSGKRKGVSDARHLWPIWFKLIRECRPAIVFGEQVSGALGFGWLDIVFAGLEAEAYSCGAVVLPACSVGAPHKRNRLWFVADTVAYSYGARLGVERFEQTRHKFAPIKRSGAIGWRSVEWLKCRDGKSRPTEPGLLPLVNGIRKRPSKLRAYGNAIVPQVAAEFIGAYSEAKGEARSAREKRVLLIRRVNA